jgi:hypothetical protein
MASAFGETMEITLIATAEEAAFIVNVIGQLPTQSNAWPVHQKLKAQFEKQVQEQQAQQAEQSKPE